MVLHMLEQGVEVVAWNRSREPLEEVAKSGAVKAEDPGSLIKSLNSPKIVWLMLPAGETTDEFIDRLLPYLEPGDLLIDGANSFYKDTLRRAEKIQKTGVHFMDIGVSGGPSGARNGACLMVGGEKQDFEMVKVLIEKIAAPDAWGYFGKVGSGHFAKMVHNGIEYGMMEAIAEGGAILKSSRFNFNLEDVFRVYNNRSVIESRLVNWSWDALKDDPDLESYSAQIGHTGEGEWTVKTAKELGVGASVIEESFKVRLESDKVVENSPNGFRNKLISAMRGKFGGHKVKKDN